MLASSPKTLIQSIIVNVLTEGGFEPVIASSGDTRPHGRPEFIGVKSGDGLKVDELHGYGISRCSYERRLRQKWGSKSVPKSIMLAKTFAPVQLVNAVSQLLNVGKPPT